MGMFAKFVKFARVLMGIGCFANMHAMIQSLIKMVV